MKSCAAGAKCPVIQGDDPTGLRAADNSTGKTLNEMNFGLNCNQGTGKFSLASRAWCPLLLQRVGSCINHPKGTMFSFGPKGQGRQASVRVVEIGVYAVTS